MNSTSVGVVLFLPPTLESVVCKIDVINIYLFYWSVHYTHLYYFLFTLEQVGHHRYFHISSAIEANPTAVSGGDTYAGSTFVL